MWLLLLRHIRHLHLAPAANSRRTHLHMSGWREPPAPGSSAGFSSALWFIFNHWRKSSGHICDWNSQFVVFLHKVTSWKHSTPQTLIVSVSSSNHLLLIIQFFFCMLWSVGVYKVIIAAFCIESVCTLTLNVWVFSHLTVKLQVLSRWEIWSDWPDFTFSRLFMENLDKLRSWVQTLPVNLTLVWVSPESLSDQIQGSCFLQNPVI